MSEFEFTTLDGEPLSVVHGDLTLGIIYSKPRWRRGMLSRRARRQWSASRAARDKFIKAMTTNEGNDR